MTTHSSMELDPKDTIVANVDENGCFLCFGLGDRRLFLNMTPNQAGQIALALCTELGWMIAFRGVTIESAAECKETDVVVKPIAGEKGT